MMARPPPWVIQTRRETPAIVRRGRFGSEGKEEGGGDGNVHLNAAGSSLPPKPVGDAVRLWNASEEEYGGYEWLKRDQMEEEGGGRGMLAGVKPALASLVGCEEDELAVVGSATDAWRQIFFGCCSNTRKVIITSESEYGSNMLNFLQAKERGRAETVVVIPNDPLSGTICLDSLERNLRKYRGKIAVVAISHIPTSNGLVQPAEKIGSLCESFEVPFLLDACQSVGQMPLDFKSLKCAALTATSRKYLRGPRGAGFLAVDKRWMANLPPAMVDVYGARLTEIDGEMTYEMAKTAQRYEQFEKAYSSVVGMGRAAEYALSIGMERIWERVRMLAELLREKLRSIEGVEVRDIGEIQCGIVSFSMAGIEAQYIFEMCERVNIAISVTRRSSSLCFFDKQKLPNALCRVSGEGEEGEKEEKEKKEGEKEEGIFNSSCVVVHSVHYYTIEEELDALIEVLETLRK